MSHTLPPRLETALRERLSEVTGSDAAVTGFRSVGGGSINQTGVVVLADGRRFFLKRNASPLPGLFEAEAAGLSALAAVGALRVPRGAFAGGGSGGVPAFLVMEAIPAGRPGPEFFETFGRRFADLHNAARGDRFGFEGDNYLGSTPQPNGWSESWVEFWRERRLGYQLRLARQRGLGDRHFERLGERMLARLDELIGEPDEPPCLLHGDLWSGNYLADERGEPVLIDPAVYYGRREADLAMTHLFGGFDRRFYSAYEEAWPLAPGSEERLEVYKLYHLLNHLNLFGGGYLGSCLAILRHFA